MNHSSSILSPKSIEAQRKGGEVEEEGGGVVVDDGDFCFVLLLEKGLKDHGGLVSVDGMRSKRSCCQI